MEDEKYLKRQRFYKIVMLVVLTAFLTFIFTTIYITKKYNLSDDEIIDLLKENGISEDDIEIVNHDKEKIITIKVKYPVINKTYEIKSKIKEAE
mgnify:CR=1 FL=1